ncbi:hypothetical protein D3C80_692770 [compost metagenome]
MFQGAANQDVPVATRNRVTPLGQHHARQEVFGAFVQNHLALDRLYRQLQAQRAQQVTAPGAGCQYHTVARHSARDRLHTTNARAVMQEAGDFAMLLERDIGQGLQCRLEGLDQPWIAHVGHIGHVDRPAEARAQHRHRIVGCRHVHRTQRPPFTGSPGQGVLLIFQVEPVKTRGVHFRVEPRGIEQALAQLRIEILGPMRQRGHSRTVAPGIKWRNNPASSP